MFKYCLLFVLVFFSFCMLAQDAENSKLDSLQDVAEKRRQQNILIEQKQRIADFNILNKDSTYAIDLRNLDLNEIPDLAKFKSLKDLELAGNNLTHFYGKVVNNPRLKEIDLSENKWEKVKFKRNDTIRELKLNDCGLKKIPRSIKKLKNLKSLELDKNEIHKIPGFIAKMKSLEDINLNFNGIQVSKADLKKLKHVKIIQFIANDLESLPDNIDVLQGARKLNFSKNKLKSLPQSISQLDSLESLIFYKNNFDSIPFAVLDLDGLTELDFYYNNISVIPSSIDRLQKLKMLFVSYNKIDKIPASLQNLVELKKLYIHHNELIGLPPWIAYFKDLEVLDVGYNKLAVLPDFSTAISLKEVDVQKNNLSEVPWSILKLPNIERLFIRDNPFELTEDEAIEFKILVENLLEKGARVVF